MRNRHPNRSVLIGFLFVTLVFSILPLFNTLFADELKEYNYLINNKVDSTLLFYIISVCGFYFLFYLGLVFLKKSVNKLMAKLHYFVTFLLSLILSILFYIPKRPNRNFSDIAFKNSFDIYETLPYLLTLVPTIFIFIQVSFLLYFIFTIKKIEN